MIPEGWEVVRLGDHASMRSGGTPLTSVASFYGGTIPWASISDMSASGKYLGATDRYLTEAGLASSPAVVFPEGVLLYAMYASIGECCISVCPMATSQAILGIKCANDLSLEFLYYRMQSERAEIARSGQQGTQANLNAQMVRETMFSLPPLKEQEAIAEVLSNADAAIESLDAMIAKKRDMKHAAMQQLLTGRRRLPAFTEEWRENKISDFTDCKAGGTPSTAVPEYWGGSIRWMSSGELNYRRVSEVSGRITNLGLANSSAQMFPAMSVLIGLAGQGRTRGTSAINLVPLSTNQSIAAIFPSSEHDSRFLYYVMDTKYDELRGLSDGGGGRGGLNLSIIRSVSVNMPTRVEQVKIADILWDMDTEIDALIAQREKAELVKQGMMQELLSGRVRLV